MAVNDGGLIPASVKFKTSLNVFFLMLRSKFSFHSPLKIKGASLGADICLAISANSSSFDSEALPVGLMTLTTDFASHVRVLKFDKFGAYTDSVLE